MMAEGGGGGGGIGGSLELSGIIIESDEGVGGGGGGGGADWMLDVLVGRVVEFEFDWCFGINDVGGVDVFSCKDDV
jgi:hypothetical protein